ncbi:MAG: hypothetical protein ACN4GW_16995 [Desulforhopalus sp.]
MTKRRHKIRVAECNPKEWIMGYGCFASLVIAILIPIHADAANTLLEEDRRTVAEEISKINEGLPRMVDQVTRWESTAVNGTTVSNVFTLLNLTRDSAPDNIGFYLYRKALDGYCIEGGYVSHLRDYEVELNLYYRDVEGEVITTVMINHEDCPEEHAEADPVVTEPKLGDTIVVEPEWLSLSDRLFADIIEVWFTTGNQNERLLGKWQNDEAPVIYQFLSNGDAHRIEGNKLQLLNYSVAGINEEKRIMLLKINHTTENGYDLYMQFYLRGQEARVAIVKDGKKTIEKWTYTGRPDMVAIASQYAYGKRPWISLTQLVESKEYRRLDDRDRSTIRENWTELFGNNKKD